MSAANVDLSSAREYARTAPWPDAFDTESRLRAIEQGVDEPTALWVREMCTRLDPHAKRNEALREAARLVEADSVSRTAKDLGDYVRRYITGMWLIDRDNGGPSSPSSQLRLALWRFVSENNGKSLSWRQILKVIDVE